MSNIEFKDLTFGYGDNLIFNHAQINIDDRWKLGLVGRNGRGKSTLLNLLQGKITTDSSITTDKNFVYFPQLLTEEDFNDKDKSKKQNTADKYSVESLSVKITDRNSQLTYYVLNELAEFEQWKLERELSLLKVDLEILWRPFGSLSGGEQTKCLLAILFLDEDNFPLIDEPTNHLDYHGRLLLSKYLKRKKSFILVSHDRDFLDRCIDHVLAINRNSIEVIKGNFSLWYDLKMNNDKREIEKNEQLKKDIGRLKKAARQNEDWSNKVEATKSVKVAGLKPDKGYVGHKAAKMMQRSKNIERRQSKAIEEKSDLLKNIETIEKLKIFPLEYSKQQLCYFNHVTISYDKHIIVENLSFDINQGDRLNLVGKNGSGKTSIIKIIMKESNNYQGKVNIGNNLKIAYLSQDDSHLKGKLDDYANSLDIDLSLFKAILRKLDFSRELFTQEISTYSKGQKKKVMLAGVLCQEAHLFILDEPLNYLDIFTRMQVQELLLIFKPTVLFVEHDKYFCDQIKTKTLNL